MMTHRRSFAVPRRHPGTLAQRAKLTGAEQERICRRLRGLLEREGLGDTRHCLELADQILGEVLHREP